MTIEWLQGPPEEKHHFNYCQCQIDEMYWKGYFARVVETIRWKYKMCHRGARFEMRYEARPLPSKEDFAQGKGEWK